MHLFRFVGLYIGLGILVLMICLVYKICLFPFFLLLSRFCMCWVLGNWFDWVEIYWFLLFLCARCWAIGFVML